MTNTKALGGCVVSNNITQKKGKLKWCVREKSVSEVDNGWRFFSEIDTEEFLGNPKNMSVWGFDTVIEIEPAVMQIYTMPVGTDIFLVDEMGVKYFADTETGERIKIANGMEEGNE